MTVPSGLLGGLLGATSNSKSSGSPVFLIVLVGIVAAVYFLFLRPQQQRQRQQRQQRSEVSVGDEVLTVGGIVGRVVEVTDEHITIVTGEDTQGIAAVGSQPTRLVLVKQGIARKVEPVVPDEHSLEHDEDEPKSYLEDHEDADHKEAADGSSDTGSDDAEGDGGPTKGSRGT